MSNTVSDVGPIIASCYTGPNNVTENYVHVWTISDFKNKMEKFKTGERIWCDSFHIVDTEWKLSLDPAGNGQEDRGWVSVYLFQESKKTVTASFDFFTGKLSTGEFIKTMKGSECQWVEGKTGDSCLLYTSPSPRDS